MLLLVKSYDRKKVKSLIDHTIIHVILLGGWRTNKKTITRLAFENKLVNFISLKI